MTEKREVLRFENIHAGYGKKEVLKGFQVSVSKGEFVGLIGSNGTGKSTLLKCVTGLLNVTEGNIWINGQEVQKLSQRERAIQVAVVPQSFDVEYDFSAEDIVMMGRNPHLKLRDKESRKDYEIVHEAMKMTGTAEFGERIFHSLSGGEKQRVIIARAIAQQSDIILLDEPTSALDIHHQIETMELMRKLNQEQGKTVLAVLHDLNLAARFCDRLILMKDGVVTAEGTPFEVITEANMRQLYDMRMLVRNNSVYDKPEIIPLGEISFRKTGVKKKIHLICGAEGAVRLMDELKSQGHTVTAGVLNEGSDDWLMAKYLELKTVDARPYTQITEEDRRRNIELFRDADILFVADVPFGNSNIENLRGLEACRGQIVVHRSCLHNDYTTDGEVTRIIEELQKKRTVLFVDDHDGFLNMLEEWKDL